MKAFDILGMDIRADLATNIRGAIHNCGRICRLLVFDVFNTAPVVCLGRVVANLQVPS